MDKILITDSNQNLLKLRVDDTSEKFLFDVIVDELKNLELDINDLRG